MAKLINSLVLIIGIFSIILILLCEETISRKVRRKLVRKKKLKVENSNIKLTENKLKLAENRVLRSMANPNNISNLHERLQHRPSYNENQPKLNGQNDDSINLAFGCSRCERDKCKPNPYCPIGHVLDNCGCCYICASVEGSRCFNSTIHSNEKRFDQSLGICGAGMDCLVRHDLSSTDEIEANCACKNSLFVCGSDNITYSSECKLREVGYRKNDLYATSWKPCLAPPKILTESENVTGSLGSDISFSCEFLSYPPGIVHWEFLADGTRERKIIPGDDSSMIQTTRGGPEKLMTTSWMQIIKGNPTKQGIYYCIVQNSQGTAQNSITLSIYA